MIEIGQKRGYFISFEGNEGTGKSTQVGLLAQALQQTGFKVCALREPGGTEVGEKIRNIVKNPKNEVVPEAELFLINAARAQLVREVIKPSLANGEVVICDRFYHSTIVYQGFGRQLNLDMVKATIEFAVDGVVPDVTFAMYVSDETAKERVKARNDNCRFDKQGADFDKRVREGYKWLCSQEGASKGKILAIDGNGTIEEVHNEIYRCCAHRISELKANQLDLGIGVTPRFR